MAYATLIKFVQFIYLFIFNKFLSERGLAFRGDDELIDSPRNGNFLGTLELIAQFDPFLAEHFEKQRTFQEDGRGRGTFVSLFYYLR